MAPEILRYEKYDAKADLWSVGAVLYEMAVGKSPFRAQNHIELLKKIDNSKGIKFPDEDPAAVQQALSVGEPLLPVPADIKELVRMLLNRNPAERAGFDDFFSSTALAKSKFPRPERTPSGSVHTISQSNATMAEMPAAVADQYRVVPPEVLDPTAMIPPSRFKFRQQDVAETSPPEARPSASPRNPPTDLSRRASTSSRPSPRRAPKPLSTEGSIIPGETEEDGRLRREYVLVSEPDAVEFNRAVDELSAPRRPLKDRGIPPTPPVDTIPKPDYITSSPPQPTFPPPPHAAMPPLSSSPSSVASRAASNALSRAISLASKKLFGSPGHHKSTPSKDYGMPASPRRKQLIQLDEDTVRDPLEDELLAGLEDLAQKTDVLTHWADEMYEYVKAIPQKPLPDPSKFIKRAGEAPRQAQQRQNADLEAEYNAVTCVAVYMLLMSFSQKGIDKLRHHQEHMSMRHPDEDYTVSKGFDEALLWFKEHFIKCNDRAALVKTWLPAQYDGPKSWLDQLVYDRALLLSRTAARKELLDQASSPDECLKLYEESLWCLYALQDDLLQTDNPFQAEDRATIATWIKRTKLRLVRCKERMAMSDKDRLRDAQADQNLADVARIPAPWDAKPASPVTT